MAGDRTLTSKQERFAQLVASGKSLSDAYRESYNAENMKPESIHCKAYEVTQNVQVSVRIAELKAELAAKSLWTREESVNTLKGVIANPEKPSDVISAVKELNAMHGFNAPTKHEVTGKDGKDLIPEMTDDELAAKLAGLLALSGK